MRVTLIDYGSGNLRSCAHALENCGAEVTITSSAKDIAQAVRLILPGVGAFGDCMQGLTKIPRMREALEQRVQGDGVPFLGICVGMQLLFERGHEYGTHEGLGWIPGEVSRLETTLKIPHMGWNELHFTHSHPLLAGIEPGAHAYFVHSYHAQADNAADVAATTDYGGAVTAMVSRGNIHGTQFHPEKSQAVGLKLLSNFLSL